MTGSDTPSSFRLGYVPGTTPAKWVRTWQERLPEVPLSLVPVTAAAAADLVRDGEADAVLLRLPTDRSGLHAIPLYTENTVVVLPKDHPLTESGELSVEQLAESIVLHPLDDTLEWTSPPGLPALERPETTAMAIELVAAGVGLLVVPQSLARLHHRKDLTFRELAGAPASRVALSWLEDGGTELTEQFIGIVRGRTVNSTRGSQREPEQKAAAGSGQGAGKTAAGKQGAGKQATGKQGTGKQATGKQAAGKQGAGKQGAGKAGAGKAGAGKQNPGSRAGQRGSGAGQGNRGRKPRRGR